MGAAVRTGLWAGLGYTLPVYDDISLGPRLANKLPGSGRYSGRRFDLGADHYSKAPRYKNAAAISCLLDPVWAHLAEHLFAVTGAASPVFPELALSRGAMVHNSY